jgi:hypothetical protein
VDSPLSLALSLSHVWILMCSTDVGRDEATRKEGGKKDGGGGAKGWLGFGRKAQAKLTAKMEWLHGHRMQVHKLIRLTHRFTCLTHQFSRLD